MFLYWELCKVRQVRTIFPPSQLNPPTNTPQKYILFLHPPYAHLILHSLPIHKRSSPASHPSPPPTHTPFLCTIHLILANFSSYIQLWYILLSLHLLNGNKKYVLSFSCCFSARFKTFAIWYLVFVCYFQKNSFLFL